MKKVLCAGTFDGLHPGHVNYFEQAKKHGDYLVVIIARDASVLKEKGRLPRALEEERRAAVAAQSIVDEAILGNHGDRLEVVKQQKPDVIVLGYDQKVNEEALKQKLSVHNLVPKLVRAEPFHPKKYKSSLLNEAVSAIR